jgi:hypothetical protein
MDKNRKLASWSGVPMHRPFVTAVKFENEDGGVVAAVANLPWRTVGLIAVIGATTEFIVQIK